MHDFLLVIVYLLGASVAMSTGTFVRCFPEWTNADQVKVVCNSIVIAQYCENPSCGNKTSPGVSLEKDGSGFCLTITNPTYDSWSCEAKSYIHGIEQPTVEFTVDLSNQHAITSPSPGTTSPGTTITSPSPGTTITSPSPGNNESHSGAIAAGVTVPIIGLVVMMIILYVLYRKRNPNQEKDIEAGDKFLQPGLMV